MAKEKKKQHYVPQAYLENWSVPNKHQVYVYNKTQRKTYLTGIDFPRGHFCYALDNTIELLLEIVFDSIGKKVLNVLPIVNVLRIT